MKKILLTLLFLGMCGRAWGQTHNYYYYLGPWVVTTEEGETVRKPPVSTVGLIDFTPPKKALSNLGFFVTTEALGAGYYLLLQGDATVQTIAKKDLNKFEQLVGYRPVGSNLVDLIYDYLTNGSDVTGKNRVFPLMPTAEGFLELHLGGHSCVKKEKFVFGVHSHTAKVKALIQNDYRKMREEDLSKGSNQYLKVLDYLGEQFKVNPQEFIPDDLPKETPLKHETTLTESFNTADSGTLGPDLTWTETVSGLDIVSNAAKLVISEAVASARTGSLSSSNVYAQSVITTLTHGSGSSNQAICIVTARRESSGEVNYYGMRMTHGQATGNFIQIEKRVGTTTTALDGPDTITTSTPETIKVECNGSTIKGYRGGSEVLSGTDTAITTSVLVGIRGYAYNPSDNDIGIFDSFEAGDLAAAPASTSLPMENMGGGLGRGIGRGMR